MNETFKTDLGKRRKYLAHIAKGKNVWKYRIILYAFLLLLSVSILLGVIGLLVVERAYLTFESAMLFVMVAICIACVPFFIALSVKNTANYNCAAPYSGMANGILILKEDSLEYIYWKASKKSPAAYSSPRALYLDEDKFMFRFSKEDIQTITVNEEHVCSVIGKGTLTVPIWASANDTVETINVKELSFITSFEQENVDEKIRNWGGRK